MNLITELCSQRIDIVLQSVIRGGTDHRELANLAAQIGRDYYGRFLIELLQNAEDQAVHAGLKESRVTVVRTDQLLAIANQGTPFTPQGIEEITSMGLSGKDPNISIGNKGIGFKAVLQVTDSPEIYSAANASGTFCDEDATRFRLSREPFADAGLKDTARKQVTHILNNQPENEDRLKDKFPGQDSSDAILAELQAALPFKFPLSLGKAHLRRRLSELPLLPAVKERTQTLIVLPLINDEETGAIVDQALEDLRRQAGSVLLFFSGIDRIEIVDARCNRTVEIVREPLEEEALGDYTRLQTVKTFVTRAEESVSEEEALYWLFSRTLGREGPPERAEQEERTLQAAVESLPGDILTDLHTATISVAFPVSMDRQGPVSLPPPDGRFFIGLPTHDCTGLPVSINAPFYGTISRTGLNLDEPLNKLLFDEAVHIFWRGVKRLQEDDDNRTRREATLMFNIGQGPLAEAIDGEAIRNRRIVLAENGSDFIAPSDMRMPARNDLEMFETMNVAVEDASRLGFILPDGMLMCECYDLLAQLAGGEDTLRASDSAYLGRDNTDRSLLEMVARYHCQDGAEFWEKFLGWVIERFAQDQLDDQTILPTTEKKGLSTPNSRVFTKPVNILLEEDADDEELSDEIPESILKSLRFIDETRVNVRETGRQYTDLARKLVEKYRLVRAPRTSDLINGALAPCLKELTSHPEQFKLAIELLHQASHWLRNMSEQQKANIRERVFLVPVHTETEVTTWKVAEEVYFGDGWLSAPNDQLLAQAYGSQEERRLLPWNEFASRLGLQKTDRDEWTAVMGELGVRSNPRVMVASMRRSAPWYAAGQNKLAVSEGVECPFPTARDYWEKYLDWVARDRDTLTRSGQPYDVKELCWIDGLERPEAREAVVALMLRNPDSYKQHTETTLCRKKYDKDSSPVDTFWTFALRECDCEVVPTNKGLQPPRSCWWLSDTERRQEFATRDLVAFVKPVYAPAKSLLDDMGATSLESATAPRLIAALHNAASNVESVGPELQRALSSWVHTLFEQLQRRCEHGEKLNALTLKPIPAEVDGQLRAVDLNSVEKLYVKDDPVRARLVPDIKTAPVLPLTPGEASSALIDALQELVGREHVLRTSTTPIDTGFRRDQNPPPCLLFEYIEQEFPDRRVVGDIAVLYAFGRPGQRPATPSGETFNRIWQQFTNTQLHRGSFRPDAAHRSAFDASHEQAPVLQVSRDMTPPKVLESCWGIFGTGCRDLFAAYASDLGDGDLSESFFSERGIEDAERDQVAAVIGHSLEHTLQRLKPVLFVLWQRQYPEQEIGQFEQDWPTNIQSISHVEEWLGFTDVRPLVNRSRQSIEPKDELPILEAARVSVHEWQEARSAIGLDRLKFPQTQTAFAKARDCAVAVFKAMAARNPKVELTPARQVLTDIEDIDCPNDLAEIPAEEQEIIDRIATILQDRFNEMPTAPHIAMWEEKIREWRRREVDNWRHLSGEAPPSRDVDAYLYTKAEGSRAANAREKVQGILKVAEKLAPSFQESIERDNILHMPRVSSLTSGWWANQYSVLLALRDAISDCAPRTGQRLSDARVFRDPAPFRELLTKFPEIEDEALKDAPEPEVPEENLLGISGTAQQLKMKLRRGAAGEIGRNLRLYADSSIDLIKLATVSRQPVPSTGHIGKSSTGGRRGSGSRNLRATELIGQVGEAFVYELFRKQLPGFDASNWVSEARRAYGFESEGDDTLGYDFEYRDTENIFRETAEESHYLIEVKATEGDGSGAFPMSTLEWRTAVETSYADDESVYVIVRVRYIGEEPEIHDIIVDPAELERQGLLKLTNKDLWVRAGTP